MKDASLGGQAVSLSTATNTALLDALKSSGSKGAWQRFVDRYHPLLVRYGRRMGLSHEDALDAAQQTLMEFCESYQQDKYEREKGRLRNWLFGVARHQILRIIRLLPQREVQMTEQGGQTDYFVRIPDERQWERAWDQEWELCVLEACMVEIRQQFDARTVEAFELFAWQGQPARQVAERLGITSNAVFIAKHRILKRIRELLSQVRDIW